MEVDLAVSVGHVAVSNGEIRGCSQDEAEHGGGCQSCPHVLDAAREESAALGSCLGRDRSTSLDSVMLDYGSEHLIQQRNLINVP